MKLFHVAAASLLATGLVAATAGSAAAQVVIPAEVEGPITSVNVAARTLVVNGVTVHQTLGTHPVNGLATTICSDSACGLTFAQLAAAPAFSGRPATRPGFIEGIANISGTFNQSVFPPVLEAVQISVSPGAEAGIVGSVTGGNCTNLECNGAADTMFINGARIERMAADVRQPASSTVRFFPANLTGAQTTNFFAPKFIAGALAQAGGYYGEVGTAPTNLRQFKYFLFDIAGSSSLLANAGVREVSVELVRARQKLNGTCDLSARGFVHTPNSGTISLFPGTATVGALGSAVAVPDEDIFYGTWKINVTLNGTCPTTTTARFGTAFSTQVTDLRIDI
jgi:hypothetical protein